MRNEEADPFLRTLLHIDVSGLTFKPVPADRADPNQGPWQEAILSQVPAVV